MDVGEGKIATGALPLNALQERLTKAFCGTDEGRIKVPKPIVLQESHTKSIQMEGGIKIVKGGLRKKQAGGGKIKRTQRNRSGPYGISRQRFGE